MIDNWQGIDPDDVDGYLMDYLNTQFSDKEGMPFSIEELQDKLITEPEWAEDIMYELLLAVRAKHE